LLRGGRVVCIALLKIALLKIFRALVFDTPLFELLLYGGNLLLQLLGLPSRILRDRELPVICFQLSFELDLLRIDVRNACAGVEHGVDRRNGCGTADAANGS
jgi:hypothetical protein